tara:strand:- start:8435 stop:9439 length:1005 start_codon:yes stop_codon:yes gene_type:complete
MKQKVLILRFSSFGDIVQSLRCPLAIKSEWPEAEVHFLTKDAFADLLKNHPGIDKVHRLSNKAKWQELWALYQQIKSENYSHIYDAHNNLRSLILRTLLLFTKANILVRPKHRFKRFLLFQLRYNLLPKPFVGQISYLEPLKSWGIQHRPQIKAMQIPKQEKQFANALMKTEFTTIAVMPSAAWPLKIWPSDYWVRLLDLSAEKNFFWYFLGGPKDDFIASILEISKNNNCMNLSGRLSLLESSAVVEAADFVISNDTGLLHVADQLEKKGFAFIGPSAFGYPLSESIQVLEKPLPCKPCSKDGSGRCKNSEYQKCMKSILPEEVFDKLCKRIG